jgi:hypothetical protein
MALPVQNNLDTGSTSGTVISSANTGGGVGNTALASATGSPTFSNAHAHSGLLSALMPAAAAGHLNYTTTQIGSGVTTLAGRVYIYLTAYPTGASYRLVQVDGVTTTDLCRIAVTVTTGTISTNVNGASSHTSTSVLPLNTWSRIDFVATVNGTTATMQARLFLGANCDGTTPDETIALSSLAIADASLIGVQYGPQSSPSPGQVWLDDIQANGVGFPGPSVVSGTGSGTSATSATAAGRIGRRGTATATSATSATATGTATRHQFLGTAAGTSPTSATAAGRITRKGTASATSSTSALATGTATRHLFLGSASGRSNTSATAAGAATRHQFLGTASATSSSSATATGSASHHQVTGSGAGTSSTNATAAGHITVKGTGLGSSSSSALAAGAASRHPVTGTGLGVSSSSATATGTSSRHLFIGSGLGVSSTDATADGVAYTHVRPVVWPRAGSQGKLIPDGSTGMRVPALLTSGELVGSRLQGGQTFAVSTTTGQLGADALSTGQGHGQLLQDGQHLADLLDGDKLMGGA